jgi:hypothetical protein
MARASEAKKVTTGNLNDDDSLTLLYFAYPASNKPEGLSVRVHRHIPCFSNHARFRLRRIEFAKVELQVLIVNNGLLRLPKNLGNVSGGFTVNTA